MRVLAFLALCIFSFSGFAQDWPARPVKFIGPYPPGGSLDPLARLLGAKLGESLGQQFIVENRTGASGMIGTAYAAKSPPDGYTFVFVFDTHAVHAALNAQMPYDPLRDLDAVMLVGTSPMAITTGQGKPFKTFAEVVAAAKAKPESVTIGNVGNGSLAHLTTMLLNQALGVRFVPVPYRGGGPLSADTIGGQVDLAMASVTGQGQHVKSGRMRALVLTGDKRSQTLPDVPTLAELGVQGVVANAWWAILARAGTPKPIIEKIVFELKKAINLPEVKRTLTETLGMDVQAMSPEATQKFIAAESVRWGKVVKDNNIKAD